MTRHALLIPLALALATAAGAAPARSWDGHHDRHFDDGPRWGTARVLSAEPIFARGGPRWREECWQEPVRYVHREYHPGGHFPERHHGGIGPSTGQVLGGIVGAAVGHQIGDGDGQRAATVAGALLGSAIARDSYRTGVADLAPRPDGALDGAGQVDHAHLEHRHVASLGAHRWTGRCGRRAVFLRLGFLSRRRRDLTSSTP